MGGECAVNNTVDELTDYLHNLLLEESKGLLSTALFAHMGS